MVTVTVRLGKWILKSNKTAGNNLDSNGNSPSFFSLHVLVLCYEADDPLEAPERPNNQSHSKGQK